MKVQISDEFRISPGTQVRAFHTFGKSARSVLFSALCLYFLTCPELLQSQDYKQAVSGTVIDADSKMPLPGATVIIPETDPVVGTITDSAGHFRIARVAVGRRNFKCSYIGYEDAFMENVLVVSGKQTQIDFELKENVYELKPAVVTARTDKIKPLNTMAVTSVRTFSVDETQRYAASFFDPARMAQSFAGVSLGDDENNEIIIRGNSARGLLWRLEGIEIPNPNHFRNGEGGSGGGICMISNAVMANSDFYTGAFPAEYGNAYSGVFDLRFRNGNTEAHEYSLQAGVIGLQASAEGPLSSLHNSSFLVNYRYSSLALLEETGIKTGGENSVAPNFQDINYKIGFANGRAGKFELFGLAGNSWTGDDAITDTADWDRWSDRWQEREYHTTVVSGLSQVLMLKNKRTYIKNIVAYSFENSKIKADTIDYDEIYHRVNDESFGYRTIRLSSMMNHKFSGRMTWRNGLILSHLNYDIYKKSLDFDDYTFKIPADDAGNSFLTQAFSQQQITLSKKVVLNMGIYGSWLALNNHTTTEPRAGLKYKVTPWSSLSLGTGIHSRYEPISIYQARSADLSGNVIRPNKNLNVAKAFHNVAAYDLETGENSRIRIEIYHQYLYHVPVASDSSYISALNFNAGYTNEKLTAKGKGVNYGTEFTAEKFFSNDYYLMTTLSLFKSKYKTLENRWRNTVFDGNYIFNFLGGKEVPWGKNSRLGANVRILFRGGYRTIPIDLEASKAAGESVYDLTRIYMDKAPDYFRIDASFSYQHNSRSLSWSLNFDIQNLTDRENLYEEYYNPKDQMISRITYAGLIPSINFRVDFSQKSRLREK